MDIPNLQCSGRWSHTDTTAVEHYLKPGLYSATPDSIRKSLPQYKLLLSISRAIYLRDKVTTSGGIDHPFNTALQSWGYPSLQRASYPTNKAASTQKSKHTTATAMRFLQKVKDKQVRIQTMRATRAHRAEHATVAQPTDSISTIMVHSQTSEDITNVSRVQLLNAALQFLRRRYNPFLQKLLDRKTSPLNFKKRNSNW